MTTAGVRRAGWFCRSKESSHANATCDYVAKCKTFPVGLFPGDIPGSPRVATYSFLAVLWGSLSGESVSVGWLTGM
jgi:hypothetical protein